MRRRYSSSLRSAFFFLSDSQAGIFLPPDTVYTCSTVLQTARTCSPRQRRRQAAGGRQRRQAGSGGEPFTAACDVLLNQRVCWKSNARVAHCESRRRRNTTCMGLGRLAAPSNTTSKAIAIKQLTLTPSGACTFRAIEALCCAGLSRLRKRDADQSAESGKSTETEDTCKSRHSAATAAASTATASSQQQRQQQQRQQSMQVGPVNHWHVAELHLTRPFMPVGQFSAFSVLTSACSRRSYC